MPKYSEIFEAKSGNSSQLRHSKYYVLITFVSSLSKIRLSVTALLPAMSGVVSKKAKHIQRNGK